jgi:hypothetical protein
MVAVNYLLLTAMSQVASAATVYLAGDSTMAKNGGGSGTGTDGLVLPHLAKPLSLLTALSRLGPIPRHLAIHTGG